MPVSWSHPHDSAITHDLLQQQSIMAGISMLTFEPSKLVQGREGNATEPVSILRQRTLKRSLYDVGIFILPAGASKLSSDLPPGPLIRPMAAAITSLELGLQLAVHHSSPLHAC